MQKIQDDKYYLSREKEYYKFSRELMILLKYWEQERLTKNKQNLMIAQ